ncbi:MAG TPA: GDYXXLXY domain-containing protein [Nitrospirota bacterium]|nr:GDYXXLXY domain-containing protein [Nitrospirota bacterium]
MRTKFIIIVLLQVLLLFGIIGYREHWLATGDKVILKTMPVDPRDVFRGDYVKLTYEITDITLASDSQKPEFVPGQPIFVSLETGTDGVSFITSVSKETPAEGRFIQGRVRHEYNDTTRTVILRDDSGIKRELSSRTWFMGIKKGDAVTVCLDNQNSPSFFFKDDAPYKQSCYGKLQSVHGIVEEVTEYRAKKVNVEYGIESYFVEEGKGIQIEQGHAARGPLKVEVSLRKDGKGIISRLMTDEGREMR